MHKEVSLKHLHPTVRELVSASQQERIALLMSKKWLGYPRAIEAIDKLKFLIETPQNHRMPNLLIYGKSDNGKTMIVNRFLREYPANDDPQGEEANIPVLLIQMPISPDPRWFYMKVLDNTFASYSPGKHVSVLEKLALHQIKMCGVRMIIIDEFHNIFQGSVRHQKQFLNLIRYLGNELRIPIVACGVPKAVAAITIDEQLANRFKFFELPLWKYDKATVRLVNGLESLLPLPERSRLSEQQMCKKILARSGKTIGGLSELVEMAAIYAIRNDKPKIDDEVVLNCGYQTPEEKKRQIRQATRPDNAVGI